MTKQIEDRLSTWGLLRTTLEEWNTDNAAHLAAALAYYTIFSIAPMFIIAVAVAGQLFGPDALRGRLVWQVEAYTNDQATAELIQTIIVNASEQNNGLIATVISVVVLLYGATGVFSELKNSLNLIWDVPPKENFGIRDVILHRLLTLLMVIISGLLLLATLVMSTALATAESWLSARSEGWGIVGQVMIFIFFFLVTLGIFALTYKFIPDVRIDWRDVWIGAVATALLFSVSRLLISLYLSHSTIQSTYGAAGSLVALLLWTYYSAQIFFLGAEFTQVYGRTWGSRWREQPLLDSEGTTTPILVVDGEEKRTEAEPRSMSEVPPPPLNRRLVRPIVEVGGAVALLTVISLLNLVREPFRNEFGDSRRRRNPGKSVPQVDKELP